MDEKQKIKNRARLRRHKTNLANSKPVQKPMPLSEEQKAEQFKRNAIRLDALFRADSKAAIELSQKMLEAYQQNDLETYQRLMKQLESL